MKPQDVNNAVPSIQATGVDESIQKDGSYDQFDVTVSVSFSPKSGQNQVIASKTERMSAKKFAAFREESNEWTGKDFLKNHFSDVWDDVQKQVAASADFQSRPSQVVDKDGNPVDGQPVKSTAATTPSSVAINQTGPLQTPDVTKAPAAKKQSDYLPPAMGPDAKYEEGPVPVYEYQANDTDHYKTPDNVKAAQEGNVDPQLPEQEKPVNPKKGNPEQKGTNTAEQPEAASVVEAAQGGATAATTASQDNKEGQAPNMTPSPETPDTTTADTTKQTTESDTPSNAPDTTNTESAAPEANTSAPASQPEANPSNAPKAKNDTKSKAKK